MLSRGGLGDGLLPEAEGGSAGNSMMLDTAGLGGLGDGCEVLFGIFF